jgi:hypothetical protein
MVVYEIVYGEIPEQLFTKGLFTTKEKAESEIIRIKAEMKKYAPFLDLYMWVKERKVHE